ncbi:MAG: T9SS C-terminal target domain-containing protein [Ignavibacteriae bacterium]|nr:MAG: T9SS C-terminal target domain-containing protein [Ignavibacteriota bacterium]
MRTKLKILFSLLVVLIIILGFTVPVNLTGGWYQQFMPYLGASGIKDITFVDSLIGYAVTNYEGVNDTDYIIKTTNSGNNWYIIRTDAQEFVGFNKVKFINTNTGYVTGVTGLEKTINGGTNWIPLNIPVQALVYDDISVWNQDTIWLVANSNPTGGVFRTNNGGANWIPQYSAGSANPSHIYMFNSRIGFMDGGGMKKTTDGGFSWTQVSGEGLFYDMCFSDSLTGWYCAQYIKKTTNGGLSWFNQTLPSGGNILVTSMLKLSMVNKDTLWAVGGQVFYGAGQFRGMIYRTINGGTNWLYQVPDTTIHIGTYTFINFKGKLNGWAYTTIPTGVHTTTGGDPIWYTGIKKINSITPKDFILYQNYPNPFNPYTTIKLDLNKSNNIKLVICDILGRELYTISYQYLKAGSYSFKWDAKDCSSGIYFYRVTTKDFSETKKMMLVK